MPIADEACAGLGVALDSSDAEGCVYRARGRELLARTGSLARIDARLLRVLPKVLTPPTGRLAFSRYACVQGPGIEARWHKIPARHRGTDLRSEYATLLLLPWPLRVQASDFHPVGSVQRPAKDPYGFFEFAPAEGLDLDLLDRVLVAARQEAGSVDVVLLPESAVDGGRDRRPRDPAGPPRRGPARRRGAPVQPRQPGQFPGNWLHIGFNPRLEKGGLLPHEEQEPWFHIRQNKHHRWSLDEGQVEQYHLGGALHPHIRWWEAMEVPRKAIQFVEVAELMLASLVCEDLAQNDDIAQLIRSVGPTIVVDGAARRAAAHLPLGGPLRERPGRRSRLGGADADLLRDGRALATRTAGMPLGSSRCEKDPTRGVREIPLEPGAHGVLLTVCMDRATRYSADGRWPVDNSTLLLRRGRPPSPRLEHRLRTTAVTTPDNVDRAGAGARRAHHPHRLGRGRVGSRGLRTRAHRPAAGRGGPGRRLAGRARPPRAIPPTRRGHRIARPSGSSSPLTTRRVVVRRLAHGRQARITPAKEPSTRWSGTPCSQCSRNGGPGNQPKPSRPAEKSPPRPPDACRGTGPLGRCLTSFDRAFIAAPPVVPRWAVGATAAIGSAQLHVLSLKPLDLRGLLGGEAGTLAAVDLRPTNPLAQRLRRDPHFGRDRFDRSRLRRLLGLTLQDHPHRPSLLLRRKPAGT